MENDQSFTVDTDALESSINAVSDIIDTTQGLEEQQQLQEVAAGQEQQMAAELEDPREGEQWGVKAIAKELQSAALGGIQDTAHSIQTFPERTIDMFSGEMARERREKGFYTPEWSPFVNEEDPIITKTWWGQLLRGTVHFGSMAVGIVGAIKASPITVPAAITSMTGYSMVRAAGIGAISDVISHTSDGENALGMVRDRYGWMDTPLSTRETDHPLIMKMKNIVEGMGIGIIFDSAALALGKGSKYTRELVANRGKTVEIATVRKGLQELRSFEPSFRASKNAPIAGRHQGNHLSDDDPFIVWERNKKIRKNWGSEEGSAGNITTPIQKERIAREAGITEDVVSSVLRKLYSHEKFQKTLAALDGSRKRLVEVFGDSIAAHQRITLGRNAADMSAEEYLKEILSHKITYDVFDIAGKKVDEITTITAGDVVTSDLVVATLLQEIRDRGIAGREIADFSNLLDIDGPADQIVDTMLTAIAESKRARYNLSREFAALGAGKRRAIQERVAKDVADARESIQSILKIAEGSDEPDLLMALFEAFSSMQTVNTVEDFSLWAKKMIRGGEIEGKPQTGSMVRELQGVMIHSVLSGPKTPMRAIMGTSVATFMRPFATAIGAGLSYPFTGDSITLRAGLASLNAMIEAIPESWTLFRSRLNSYWTGDIATVKTRFAEYTRGDDNWEVLRRWTENSPDATAGDKAAFNLANMARQANNSNFLTYSTKLMAATDDAFAYILGRAKMREKAFRSAVDAKGKGALTTYPEITPELIRIYEDDFYRQIFDANGNIIDEATKFARKEVTLTKELRGMAAGLNSVFQANPWAKPFFLFARTGVNGLELTAKHTPGFNFLVKEWNDIAFATNRTLERGDLAQYGITTLEELANAKALQVGRLAMGSSLIFMANQAWMRGELTGNGPADRQKRQSWLDAGWKPRHFKLGGIWIGYDSIEPFNQIMSIIADVGDASQLMGSEWTEKELQKVSLVIAQGITSKSYLAGMQQFVDLFAGRPGQAGRIVSSIMNNTIPLAGLRNELGKVFTPHTRELSSGIMDALRNRNLYAERLPGENLPIKYDLLNGKPIKDHDPMTRMFNAMSPISLHLDYTPGRKFLYDSGYDMRMSVYSSPGPNPINLSDAPKIRSLYQKAIGDQNLELQLAKLAKDPKAIASLEEMQRDIRNGNRGKYEAGDYYHNRKIHELFTIARRIGWAQIRNESIVQDLIKDQTKARQERGSKKTSSAGLESILTIYK